MQGKEADARMMSPVQKYCMKIHDFCKHTEGNINRIIKVYLLVVNIPVALPWHRICLLISTVTNQESYTVFSINHIDVNGTCPCLAVSSIPSGFL